METNCNNSDCVISTYSLFDKYFNSWMSTEMVVSTFGPTLLYQTKQIFGWTGRKGFFTNIREDYQAFLDRFRKSFMEPGSFLFNQRVQRIRNALDTHPNWREWWMKMVSGSSDGTGYFLGKTEEFQHFLAESLSEHGFLSKIKTAQERYDFIRFLYDVRSVLRAGKARLDDAKAAYELAYQTSGGMGFSDPVVRQKYIEFGREIGRFMDETLDEGVGMDYIEWVTRHPNAGFYDKGVKIVYPDGRSEFINLFQEHRTMQRIIKKFYEDGTFAGFETNWPRYGISLETRGDSLVLYSINKADAKRVAGLSYSNIKNAASNKRDLFILDNYGNFIPYNNQSWPFIQSRMSTNADVYEGAWTEFDELTPLDFTARLDNARNGSTANLRMPTYNIQQLIDAVEAKNWKGRRYWNALDKLMLQEETLVKNYFTLKGGAKWTALPFAYWWAKKGFGVEDFSFYQLPDTWHTLKFTLGEEDIYDYAYIDFFANAGSDQGDLFLQVLNNLPWKLVLDELSDKYNPIKNLYDKFTKNEIRNETENLAFYFTGPEECADCTMVLRTNDLTRFKPFFFTKNQEVVSYILEDTESSKAKSKGQTLIAFASHTNLEGKTGDSSGEPINLAKALKDEDIKTCAEAIEDLELYGLKIGKIAPDFVKKDGRIGFVLAGLESITYASFFWAGIFSSIVLQVSVAPQLHGCVDVDEGYYAHYFVPAEDVKQKKKTEDNFAQKSSEKVSEMISSFKETFVDSFEGNSKLTKEAVESIGKDIEKFAKDAKSNDIVQATLVFSGLSSGQLDSRDLFYFWCGKGCEINPASYKQVGEEELRGVNDKKAIVDFESGKIFYDGAPIVESEDNVRMSSTNLNIPAIEVPRTLTESCIENSDEPVMEVSVSGEVRVLNDELLGCIKEGVLAQSGLPLNSSKLNDAFGSLNLIVTSTHPNVKTLGDKIVAEGTPRKVAEGSDSKIIIYANKDVNLSSSNDGFPYLGKLESIQFDNGSIVVKPNSCFLVWLRHHEDAVLNKDYVKGIKPIVERQFNEETKCEEPAIDFTLLPDLDSDFQVKKVDTFNEALKHQGPFTVFETPEKRYVLYSEPSDAGDCVDHLKIINKSTGEMTDYAGVITQIPNGFKITTSDGRTHIVKFLVKDGAPFLQFNDEKPELLTSAQGKNGAFYYNPDNGLWYAENAQLLPLLEAFREGIAAKVQPNGEATATASGNVLNLDLGKDNESGFLNLPSLPEQKHLLFLFIVLLLASLMLIRSAEARKKNTLK